MPRTNLLQNDVTWELKDDVWNKEEEGYDGIALSYAQL